MYFLKMPDATIVGSSPEMLVKIHGSEASYRPIAGTRPRGSNSAEDEHLALELLADEKERAEHIMLVDLGRNDLGRVCKYGTVRVEDLMFIERYSHVMHLVSSLRGTTAGKRGSTRYPDGLLSRRDRIRCSKSARDGNHR
jgi:anthranilate synthase component 1